MQYFFRLLNQRVLEVTAELEDVTESQKSSSAASSSEVISMRTKLTEARQRLEEKDRQLAQRSKDIEEITIKLSDADNKVVDMTELLRGKEEEIHIMEEKYKKYLEKAKNVREIYSLMKCPLKFLSYIFNNGYRQGTTYGFQISLDTTDWFQKSEERQIKCNV